MQTAGWMDCLPHLLVLARVCELEPAVGLALASTPLIDALVQSGFQPPVSDEIKSGELLLSYISDDKNIIIRRDFLFVDCFLSVCSHRARACSSRLIRS